MEHFTVAVIGGGATGTGILRDLALRGISAVLFEQGSFAHGTSARFHGLLHSGARYAVKDSEAAKECLDENRILRTVAKHCIEETEGYFALVDGDDENYVPTWLAACSNAQIPTEEVDIKAALLKEPNLSPHLKRVFAVPDSCVDGFRLLWHNAVAAKNLGAQAFTYHKVLQIHQKSGAVSGLLVLDRKRKKVKNISCDFVINASGAWAGEVASLAGLDVPVSPDKGTLVVFNHRFTSRVINRLRPSGDGDIFVPHGSVTIFGTTSNEVSSPNETRPTTNEVLRLLELGKPLFPAIEEFRLLRAFAGNRPLYASGGKGRHASRNFHIVDHEESGLKGFLSIFGGKLTTYRLMAEKAVDVVCSKMGVHSICQTAKLPLVSGVTEEDMQTARKYFKNVGAKILADRAGIVLPNILQDLQNKDFRGEDMVCECEMVTKAEIATVSKDSTTHSLHDIRLRTRFGMGTCQGTFCSMRVVGLLAELKIPLGKNPKSNVRGFLQERWQGVRPVLWGAQLKETELTRAVYAGSLNLDGSLLGQSEEDEVVYDDAPALIVSSVKKQLEHRTLPITGNVTGVRNADVVVVGAGLAGLVAALAASYAGKKVRILTNGSGAINISGGNIDLLGYVGGKTVHDPWQAMQSLPANHPYQLLGKNNIEQALTFFNRICLASDYRLADNHGKNLFIPTIIGTLKPTYLCAASVNPAFIEQAQTCLLVGIQGFKDCGLALLGAELRNHPAFIGKHLNTAYISTPFSHAHRPVNALDVARFLNTQEGQSWFISQLKAHTKQTDVIIAPPVCGTEPNQKVWLNLSKALGTPIVEMNTVPPGVGGLRIKELLYSALAKAEVEIVENVTVSGARTQGTKCLALATSGLDGQRFYEAESFVLATGGFLGGGLVSTPHHIFDKVFGIEVPSPASVLERSSPKIFGKHFYAGAGLAVDNCLSPVDGTGEKMFENVFAAGRILGGYDFAKEKSGHGVAIATGWFAGVQAGGQNA